MIYGVIPARFASVRFPGKLLADLNGKSVLERTWRAAAKSSKLGKLIIAAGDERVGNAAREFGAEVVDVFDDFNSGSDRIAAAMKKLETAPGPDDIIVNIQGDEPLIGYKTIDKIASLLSDRPSAGVTTACSLIQDEDEYNNPNVVKVVLDKELNALYFSRASIPDGWRKNNGGSYRHIGIYAYRWRVLEDFVHMAASEIERLEKLEQLRFLHNGVRISVAVVDSVGPGIDTKQDLELVKRILK